MNIYDPIKVLHPEDSKQRQQQQPSAIYPVLITYFGKVHGENNCKTEII